MSNLTDLSADKSVFVLQICKVTANKINHLQSLLKNFEFYSEITKLRNFLEVYSMFYALTLNSILLRENKRLEKLINENEKVTKSISEIHFENSLIATKITELEKNLAVFRDSKKDLIFVSFVFEFYEKVLRRNDLMKWFNKKGNQNFPGNEK